MVRGRGASNGPDLSAIAARSTRPEMERWLDNPTSLMGTKSLNICPGWAFCADFQWALQDVNLKIRRKTARFRPPAHRARSGAADPGRQIPHAVRRPDRLHHPAEDQLTCRSFTVMRTSAATCWPIWALWAASMPGPLQHEVPPVTPAEIDAVMHPKPGDWATYNGRRDGNHYNPLAQINTAERQAIAAAMGFRARRRGPGRRAHRGGWHHVHHRRAAGLRPGCQDRPQHLVHAAHQRSWRAAHAGRAGGGPFRTQAPAAAGPNRGVAHSRRPALLHLRRCLHRLPQPADRRGDVVASRWPSRREKGKIYTSASVLVVNDLVITGIAGGDSPDARLHRRLPCQHRQAGLALLYHSQAGRATVGNLDRPGTGNRRRRDLGNRLL